MGGRVRYSAIIEKRFVGTHSLQRWRFLARGNPASTKPVRGKRQSQRRIKIDAKHAIRVTLPHIEMQLGTVGLSSSDSQKSDVRAFLKPCEIRKLNFSRCVRLFEFVICRGMPIGTNLYCRFQLSDRARDRLHQRCQIFMEGVAPPQSANNALDVSSRKQHGVNKSANEHGHP